MSDTTTNAFDDVYTPNVFIRPLYFTPTEIVRNDRKQRLYVPATSVQGGYPSENSWPSGEQDENEIRNTLKLLTVLYGDPEPYLGNLIGDGSGKRTNWSATCASLRSKLSNAASSNARLLLVREVTELHDFDVWRHNLGRQIAILRLRSGQTSEVRHLRDIMDREVEKLQGRIAALIVALETRVGNVVPRRMFHDKPFPQPVRTLNDMPIHMLDEELRRLKSLRARYLQQPSSISASSELEVEPEQQPYSLMSRAVKLSATIWTQDLFLLVAHEWLSPFRDAFDVEANLQVPTIVSMLFYRFRYTCDAQYSYIVAPTLAFDDIRVSSANVFLRTGEADLMPILRKKYKNHMSHFRERFERLWPEGNSLADILVLPGSRAKGPRAQEQLPTQPAVRATAVDEETRVDFVL